MDAPLAHEVLVVVLLHRLLSVPQLIVLDESESSHDPGLDELADGAEVVLEVAVGGLLRHTANVKTTARHCKAIKGLFGSGRGGGR
jgi:hypothetical protein